MTERRVSGNEPGPGVADSSRHELSDESQPHRLDLVFGILQNERRRRVLRYLQEHESTTQGELAEHVAAIENDVPRKSLTSTQRKRVYVSLYQSHLPKLRDAGAVEYDADRGTVERVPETDEFLQYLDSADGEPENPSVTQSQHTLAGAALLAGALLANLLTGTGAGVDLVSAISILLVGFACGLVVRGYRA
ncbi:MAG: ArsR family transcriptional regulator [Haloferacaceae archaeon]